jgi:hypothetical protein
MIKVYLRDNPQWIDCYKEFDTIKDWAVKNCKSFSGMGIHDVSDFSTSNCDFISEFSFLDDRDELIFRMRWGDLT